jgi:hypothetical protein
MKALEKLTPRGIEFGYYFRELLPLCEGDEDLLDRCADLVKDIESRYER